MLIFFAKRLSVMLLTAICLTFVVFFLTNLHPNLEKLAKQQASMRMTDVQVTSWLEKNGYAKPVLIRYGEWLGIAPGWVLEGKDGAVTGRCINPRNKDTEPPRF